MSSAPRLSDPGARELATRFARAIRPSTAQLADSELRQVEVVVPAWGQIQRAQDGTTFVEAVIQISPPAEPPSPEAA